MHLILCFFVEKRSRVGQTTTAETCWFLCSFLVWALPPFDQQFQFRSNLQLIFHYSRELHREWKFQIQIISRLGWHGECPHLPRLTSNLYKGSSLQNIFHSILSNFTSFSFTRRHRRRLHYRAHSTRHTRRHNERNEHLHRLQTSHGIPQRLS